MPECQPRRRFLKKIGVGAAGVVLGAPLVAARGRGISANERIGLGIIGVGDLGGGSHHLGRVLDMPELEVLAVADVDAKRCDKAVARSDGKAKAYADFRHLLDRKDIDAVIIATPDHWHALAAISACEAGKDVYCEKPLSLTIADGRAMVNAARSYDRVFQTGTQQRSDKRFHQACDLVRNGRIGQLEHVKVVLGRGPVAEWETAQGTPDDLEWNAWLGPAPRQDYHQNRCHYKFRWFFDYSGGKMTDWGAHHLDIAQWAIGAELSGPVKIRGTATFPAENFYETPRDFDVHYTYANGVTLHATGAGENGVTLTGSEGEIFVNRRKITANPVEILKIPAGSDRIVLPRSRDHHQNWVDCIRSRKRPISDVEIGHRSATVCHLGNIAIRVGREIAWDPKVESIRGDEAADRLVAKPMRKPWSLT